MRNIGMKVIIIVFSVFVLCILSGCGGSDGSNGVDGEPCIVEQLEDGTYISCADSDAFIPNPSVPNDSDDASDASDVVDSDPPSGTDSDGSVYCKRGKGHKKHDHTKHEHCKEEV